MESPAASLHNKRDLRACQPIFLLSLQASSRRAALAPRSAASWRSSLTSSLARYRYRCDYRCGRNMYVVRR
ncbi:hypothetical protein E2C01_099674 [Portunus trituberculatus]|uniref:Uncharacterized protein n=1 Tax=Portunus trituberculatus TaxID=210409 RepID=A0A5B7KBI5_PORTR|nr:hypothetical protein [Portunus trituberculatus]